MANISLYQEPLLKQLDLRYVESTLLTSPHNFCYIRPSLLTPKNIFNFVSLNRIVIYYLDKNIYRLDLDTLLPQILQRFPDGIRHLPLRYEHLITPAITNNYLVWLYCVESSNVSHSFGDRFHQGDPHLAAWAHSYPDPCLYSLSEYRKKFPMGTTEYQQLIATMPQAQQKCTYLQELKALPGSVDYVSAQQRFECLMD